MFCILRLVRQLSFYTVLSGLFKNSSYTNAHLESAVARFGTLVKDNFGLYPCAHYLRRETGKVVWVLSFGPFTILDQYSFLDTLMSDGYFLIFLTDESN